MNIFSLTAISPIDGRYKKKVKMLCNVFSEYAFMKFRIHIEIKWLKKLSTINKIKEIPPFNTITNFSLKKIIENFDKKDAMYIKEIEKKTHHDIKAIEYFLKEKISLIPQLHSITEFVHFACTSEDINNLSYAMMLKKTKNKIIIPYWEKLIETIKNMSLKYRKIAILSRTHGQPATPSTLGKEIANFVYRMQRQLNQLKKIAILGKMNGTVGNYNAHIIAYPEIDWIKISKSFVNSLKIQWNPYTTQIEPHDYLAEIFDCISRFNTILINFNRDMWGYISLNYFTQKNFKKEIGSSIMPHKINPINFENSEGNLGIANAIFNHFSRKLPISRWQRDLTDSTILRNIGVSIAYSIIAYKSTLQGLKKIQVNNHCIKKELNKNLQILAEPIQTIMRRYNIKNPYEKLKKLTKGKNVTIKDINNFIENLSIPIKEKIKLKLLRPDLYTGYAEKLVNNLS